MVLSENLEDYFWLEMLWLIQLCYLELLSHANEAVGMETGIHVNIKLNAFLVGLWKMKIFCSLQSNKGRKYKLVCSTCPLIVKTIKRVNERLITQPHICKSSLCATRSLHWPSVLEHYKCITASCFIAKLALLLKFWWFSNGHFLYLSWSLQVLIFLLLLKLCHKVPLAQSFSSPLKLQGDAYNRDLTEL